MRLSGEAIADYLRCCEDERRLDRKTVRAYGRDLQQAIELMGDGVELSKDAVRVYVARLNALFAPATVKRKIASLRAFASYREIERADGPSPFGGMRLSIREPRRLPRVIPLSDLELLFESAASMRGDLLSKRDRAILEVLIACFCQ